MPSTPFPFTAIVNAHADIIKDKARSLDGLVGGKIETKQERDFALRLLEDIEGQVQKLIRDVRRGAMSRIPAKYGVK